VSTAGPGFVFWGLFVVFGAVVVAYVVWMLWIERRERDHSG
jgi:phage shock protein PspC (stress-responsive transcriptional regulator)